jgi:hypothetical protein
MLCQPLLDLRRLTLQALLALDLPGLKIRLGGLIVLLAVTLEHHGGSRFQLRPLLLEVRPRAALALARIARQLHSVDGEHLLTDQALALANANHCGKDLLDVLLTAADEICNRREVRGTVTTQGHERHVVAAGALDSPAAHNALRIGEQHHLQQHRRRVGRRAPQIIVVVCVEVRQIQLVVDQVAQGVLECSWQ